MDADVFFIKEAISLAEKNAKSDGGGPFGAIIVKDGKIIASASNTVTVDFDPTAHAEVNVIRKACKCLDTFDLSGCVLYTSCEPCPMCLSASYWAHIDKIIYSADREDAADAGFDDDFIYKEFLVPKESRSLKIEQILHSEGLAPFLLWKENEKKIEY
jgi:guanine deaminase